MKYIDAEKLKAEIEFAKSVYSSPNRVVQGIADVFRQDGRAAMCDDLLKKIDSLQQEQPSLPFNLDEAAEEYTYQGIPDTMKPIFKPLADEIVKHFKAGAEWMAGQGYTKEETVYFERLCDENRIMVDLGWGEPERGGFNPGDKVVVQIRKK